MFDVVGALWRAERKRAMTEIRVERKTGVPWWGYLLIVLVVLALASVAMRGCGTPSTSGALGTTDGTGDRVQRSAGFTGSLHRS